MAEWLRCWTANPMGSARVSLNLILVRNPFFNIINLIVDLVEDPRSARSHVTVYLLSRRFKNMSFSSKAIQNPSKIRGKSLEIFDSRSPLFVVSVC